MAGSSKDIVWIASYPKSGNTWVRFLACNLLYGPQDSAASLSDFAPDIHELPPRLRDGSHQGLVKTHYLYSSALPLAERTAGALYVVRDPVDVLVSNFHYLQRSAATAADSAEAFDRYFDAFLVHRGDPRWARLGMGSWESNVCSWLRERRSFPVLAIRYEDLSRDPGGVGRRMAEFLRPSSTAEEIERAVENSSFRRMQAIEDADIRAKRVGIFYKPYLQKSIDAGNRFMREGAAGAGSSRLTAEQRARAAAAFGPLLAELELL